MTKTPYLYKQAGSSNWHFRFAVPQDLVPRFGRREVKKSTGTSDLKKAEVIRDRLVSECRQLVSEFRKENPVDFKVRTMIEQHRLAYPDMTDDDLYDTALDVFDPRDGDERELEAAARALGKVVFFRDYIVQWKVWASKKRKASTIQTWGSYLLTFTKYIKTPDDMRPENLLRASNEAGQGRSAQLGTVSAVTSLCKFLEQKVLYKPINTDNLKRFYVTAEAQAKQTEHVGKKPVGDTLEAVQENRFAYDLLRLGAYTGRRCVALSNLRTADVDLENRTLVIRYDKQLKNGRTETIPYHDDLHSLLSARVKDAGANSWLFKEYDDLGPDTTRRSNYANSRANKALDAVSAGYTFHQLRHKVITLLTNLRVEPEVRKALVGHNIGRDTHTNVYFGGFEPEVLRSAINRLEW